jgi:hypothetical protein
MATQLENLKKGIVEGSLKIKQLERSNNYVNLVVEISPDPIAASILFASYLRAQNIPFTLRFIDPLLTISNLVRPSNGVTLFLGYTGVQKSSEHQNFEISYYSDPPSNENILNPYLYGLNGSLISSTTALSYLVLKELGYDSKGMSSIIIGGILSSQVDLDPEKLGGLNKAVLNELEQKGLLETSKGLKAPVAEGLDLSIALSMMLDPYVMGISGDPRGSSLLVQQLVKRKQLSKSSGIITGSDARALFDEMSKVRVQTGFREIDENTLLGSIYMDRTHPVDSPLRNILGAALALEACVNMQNHLAIYKLFLCGKKELYKQILESLQAYSMIITDVIKQITQAQEYFRETQNALYISAPPQTHRGLALRTVKIVSQNKAYSFKPVIMVSSINQWSQVVGVFNAQADLTIDLGNTFKVAADRSRGVGYGSTNQAVAYIPNPFVESFFDDVDVRLSG